MPESVDSPAPDRTSAPPSASRSVSAVTPSTVAGAAVTPPWSLPASPCARAAPGGPRAPQPLQQCLVEARQSLGGERALEEAADAARPVPRRPHPDRAHRGVGGV